MRVMVDLDPRDVWRIQDQAERRHVDPGVVLREELAARRSVLEFRNRVRSRVLAGMCDADIAEELKRPPGYIAQTRRGLGLPANPRYRKSAPAAERKSA
ncbi:hypothetical protein [Microbacterium sp. cx-59]|uniref:hypothetical protein n=1 Tax=Microbacterium sp. cx-59 TaxID=2891207 RepID=UPI001E597A12|nr:hypothetical protein [Microbacterium sp. cx-59]MCC4906946.1 hypothetical protein [Microbacterium sp. cx-59]